MPNPFPCIGTKHMCKQGGHQGLPLPWLPYNNVEGPIRGRGGGHVTIDGPTQAKMGEHICSSHKWSSRGHTSMAHRTEKVNGTNFLL